MDAARLAVRLAFEAVADLIGWAAHGIRSGSSMFVAWLISLAVAGRHRLRHGSATAGRHVRAGSAATRDGLRASSAATRDGLRASTTATREGLRSSTTAAGRGVRGAGAGIAGAAGGLASRIDALAERGRAGRAGRAGGVGSERPAGGPAGDQAATQEFDVAGNGHADGAGGGRLVLDPGDPVEAWWLPSSMVDQVQPVEEAPAPVAGRRARAGGGRARAGAGRDPVVAGLAGGLDRVARPFRAAGARLAPAVTALAAPPDRRRRGWLPFARPVVVALALTLLVATATAVPAGILVADSVKGAGAGLPELEELRQLRQPERTQVYDRQGRVIEVLKDEQDRIVVPLSKISPTLQQAVVAAEDARFYEHQGRRRPRDRACRGHQPAQRRGQPGRQHHHPAAGPQQLPRPQGHLDRPQDQGGRPRRPARGQAVQGRDPAPVPEPGLLRRRVLRGRGGQQGLLPPRRLRGVAGPGGHAGRGHPGAGELRPPSAPRAGQAAARLGAGADDASSA